MMQTLGPYNLESILGRGGMGTVYRATHSNTGEVLAVKVLSPAYTTDDHFRNRFESEIKALLKLDHPNIVRLIGYGQFESNLYFAMELVEGQSLFQLQRNGNPFHWREVLRIAKNVSLGLRHAHDRGIIHRDLKPGNLLRAETGIIKITDFGIAKSFGQNQNTGTNVLGTVDFMSPEQAKGQPATVRSDLYSLGSVMYSLLAGRPPFSANSVEESMRNLTKVPAPRVVHDAPDVPQSLDNLIAQLLEKDPAKRFSTALSLYHRLRQIEEKLRASSQAQTAERPAISRDKTEMLPSITDVIQSASDLSDDGFADDFLVSSSKGSHEDSETIQESRIGEGQAVADSAANGQSSQPREDFFNKVTEKERMNQLALEADRSEPVWTTKILLAASLVVVVSLAGYGFYRTLQVASADSLLASIEESWQTPQKKIGDIRKFLTNYPDHELADQIKIRLEIAQAFQKVHQLRARRRTSNPLTEIESRFLAIVDESGKDAPKSLEKMRALITLYEDDQQLTDQDAECIEAARAYSESLLDTARNQIDEVRGNIKSQLERASELSGEESIAVYESIIELNQHFDWAADLVESAREKIRESKGD